MPTSKSPETNDSALEAAFNPVIRHPSNIAHAYRPEIDGLRAVAVIAVLINHLNPAWLPGGYLGVDLFFVISGYVVTGSLLGRQTSGLQSFLLDFYRRRFRRLMPALFITVITVSLLVVALIHPGEDTITPILRSGIASIFGASNLYLLKQGNNYFAPDNHYNPFLHTWSLGVEEQFYLVWPLVLLVCGIGLHSATQLRRRLTLWSAGLSIASLVLLFWLKAKGEDDAIFYLMPTRFWELAAGALILLSRFSSRQWLSWRGNPTWQTTALLLALGSVFVLPESWRLVATFCCVAISAALLGTMEEGHAPGSWLTKSWPMMIGRSSYSLYLWHWPVIVLARWSVGINPITFTPILALIALLTAFSYRIETHFRRPGHGDKRMLVRYPLIALASAGGIGLLLGPARGALFIGDRSIPAAELSNRRHIPGTTLNTVNCFRDPTAPLSDPSTDSFCLVRRHPGNPTLFFEGDSHTEVLFPIGQALLERGSYNVAFSARGGCPVPAFAPWASGRDQLARYRLCAPDTVARLARRLEQIAPGDQLVLSVYLPGYLLESDGRMNSAASAAHSRSIRQLARQLENRSAGLILFAPLPSFPQRPALAVPASLCLPEWYRPKVWREPTCAPSMTPRSALELRLSPVERHLHKLESTIPNLRIFRPFTFLCPPEAASCSTHRGDLMLFTDSNHLSINGVRSLEDHFLRFLSRQPTLHESAANGRPPTADAVLGISYPPNPRP